MYNVKQVTEDTFWIGANERKNALFENIFPLPKGVSFNSYLIKDEKTALLDTVDASVTRQFFENLDKALDGRTLDYLIIDHMEPDHCAAIVELASKYPELKIVGNAKTFTLLGQFFSDDYSERAVLVKEGESLTMGKHTLSFYMAPMVHWPEAMVTFDETTKTLFSADAFGSFGALNGSIFADEYDFERVWLGEARRYYTNIVGKYGSPVQGLLKKAAKLEIANICPLHGPLYRKNLEYIINKYNTWSTYTAEEKGVVIIYASMYGSTASAAEALASKLSDKGAKNITVYDVSCADTSTLISEIFRVSHIVFACPTYNAEIYPLIANVLADMKMLAVQNKTVAIIENGSWAPVAGRKIVEKLGEMKNMTVIDKTITIKSSMSSDRGADIDALADSITATM